MGKTKDEKLELDKRRKTKDEREKRKNAHDC